MTDAPATEVAIIPKETAVAVLTNPERFDDFIAGVRAKVMAHVPDLTTAAGRKAIASNAFLVTKSKTALTDAADKLTEEWRANTAKVVASRKKFEEQLSALQKEARKPLTDWEDAEEEREKQAAATLEILRSAAVVMASETAAELQTRLDAVLDNVPDAAVMGDHYQIAMNLRDHAAESLSAGVERAKKAEQDAAELATLRAQAAAREQEEQERREREEQERIEREAQEIREREAQEEQERQEQAERDRQEKANQDAAAARQKDRAHKASVMGAAKEALIPIVSKADVLTPADIAISIVRAIVAGEIPAVTLAF